MSDSYVPTDEELALLPQPPGPYENDLEYLQDELDWLDVRAHRIVDEILLRRIEAGEGADDYAAERFIEDAPPARLVRARAKRNRTEEDSRRADIDYRLRQTRLDGTTLALDRLCESHGLDDFERTILLLSAAPCFSRRYEELLESLDAEKASSGVTVEVVLFGDRAHGNALMTLLLTELERFEGVAVLATNLPQTLDQALDRRILVKVQFPEPDRDSRCRIWRKHLPEKAPIAADVDLELLADRFEMTGGYIKNAVLMAVAEAVHTNGISPFITMAHLEKAALDQLRRPLEENSPLAMPRVRLSDVILPERLRDRIGEFLAAARNRRTVLERWGIGAHLTYGKGLSALFHGLPGTGKTLCAEAIACELNQPLQVVAIPAVVSKWVGQTEQTLDRLFQQSRAANSVLFLDEADTLLMERGEGRASRHDDSIVNTLLTLIERHDGVVLLATNLPDRLDKALSRRLTYRLEFPFPEAAQRAAIWKRLLPATVPVEGDIDFVRLGTTFRLSGGNIRNAVFKAAFRAADTNTGVSQGLLEQAAAEEGNSTDGLPKRPVGFVGR